MARAKIAKLWRSAIRPKGHTYLTGDYSTGMTALNAYDIPIVTSLVRYLHACAGFPVRSTWIAATKYGNFASWLGLTYANATKYCPVLVEYLKGHMTQTRQGSHSTKPKPPQKEALPDINSQLPTVNSK